MKKLLLLLPCAILALVLTGCVDEVVVDRPAPRAVYYGDYAGDPYYVYGGTNYYYVGGRYFYYRNHQRFYVTGVPGGGFYYHNGRHYRNYNRGRWY